MGIGGTVAKATGVTGKIVIVTATDRKVATVTRSSARFKESHCNFFLFLYIAKRQSKKF